MSVINTKKDVKMIAEIINGRYRVLEKIGEGGKSVVYKTRDLHHGRNVALKLMKDQATSTYIEDLIRFKKQIQIMSNLDHPNIIKVYGEDEYHTVPFIVMELLEGEVLSNLLSDPAIFPVNEAVSIIKQTAKALKFVHNNGIIHRDIKPGNIFIVRNNAALQVKLLDFGIAWIVELGAVKEVKEIAGTFGYMSPEATGMLDKRIDERSDLYSLGVVFYHLLTGEAPFKGDEINRILHQQVALNPVKPRKINHEIPSVLEAIVMKLLNKDPDMRYQSAGGLISDLEKYERGECEFEVAGNDQKVKITYQTRLVGRDQEIEKIKNRFDMVTKGKGSFCLIAGEAGAGKSRLVEEIKRFVYEQNGIFLKGRCLNYENKFPYQPFKDTIDEYLNKLKIYDNAGLAEEKRRIKDLLGDLSGLVVKLNPRFEQFLGPVKEVVPLESERENQRFLMTLTEFFYHLTGSVGCVLFLDDLQWADESSFNLLEELLRKVENSNLLIIGTYRDNEIKKGHRIEKIIEIAQMKKTGFESIRLQPLAQENIKEFIHYILGENVQDIDSLSRFIFNKSSGNPFFTINMIRELVEKKILFWDNKKWQQDSEKLFKVPISNSLLDIILQRVNILTDHQKDLLVTGAVIGREFEIELLYKLTALSKTEVVEMIDDFIGMQLLERSAQNGSRIIFVHDRIRDAFYHTISAEERKRIHWQIAVAIEEMNRDNLDNSVYELAHHFFESGHTAKTLHYVIPAGRKAQYSNANEEAIMFYKIGAGLLESGGKTGDGEWFMVNEELGKVYLTIGKNEEVIHIIQKILPLATGAIDKARLYRTLGTAYFKKGDWTHCETNLFKALEIMGESIPQSKIITLLKIAKEIIVYESLGLIFKYVYPVKEVNTIRETRKEIFWTYYAISWMHMLSDNGKMIWNVMRMMNISNASFAKTKEAASGITGYAALCMAIPLFARAVKNHQKAFQFRSELNDEWGAAQALQFLGYSYSWRGNHEDSIKNYEASLQRFKKIGDIWEIGKVLNGLGLEYCYLADYERALDYFTQYLDFSQQIDDNYGYVTASKNIGWCYIEGGDHERAKIFLGKALDQSKEIPFLNCLVKALLGRIELDQGNYQKSVELLFEAREIDAENVFLKHYTTLIHPYLAEAYLCLTEASFHGLPIPREKISKVKHYCLEALRKTKRWTHHYGSSLLVTAKYYDLTGNPGRAEYYFLKSIAYNQRIKRPFELGRSYYEYAMFLKSQPQSKSNAVFKHAYDVFKTIHAQFYLLKCIDALGIENMEYPKLVFSEANTRNRLKSDQRIETILTTGSYLSSILDLDRLLEKIMDSAIEIVGAERGALFLYSEDETMNLELKVQRNISPVEYDKGFSTSFSIISKVVVAQKPIIVADALSESEFKMQSSVVLHGIRSVLGAPIMFHGKMIGVLYLDNNLVSGLFKDEDLKIIDLLMNQAGISIENARLYKRLKENSREIEASRNKMAIWNQELEQRVLERTKQLNSKNNELQIMNQELFKLNRQLEEYAATAEELAVVKERNRVAKEVHDTLGHTLTLLIMLMKLSKIKCEQNPEETKEKLTEAIQVAQDGLKGLRSSILGLMSENLSYGNLVDGLEKLFKNVADSGVKIDFSMDGEDNYYKIAHLNTALQLSEVILKICQEAITNSIRHGNAVKVTIILQFTMEVVKLFIVDDGRGSKTIHKGFGLSGMEERVRLLKGTIVYGSDGEKGFNIHVEIPLFGENNRKPGFES
jgi:serine/threonine protein kinase/signal transduction histidine kinase/Tfp pilus assembly protein PilF